MYNSFSPHGEKLSDLNMDRNSTVYIRYEKSLSRQLESHSLPIPEMDLFPAMPDKGNGRYYAPHECQFLDGQIIGESFIEAERSLLGHFSNDDVYANQLMCALHEAVHHICRVFDSSRELSNELVQAQNKYPDHSSQYGGASACMGVKDDINPIERMSDGASLLYMLSNYQGDVSNLISCWMNRRIAHVSVQHNTSSTMEKVIKFYHDSPKQGLDIVECVDITKNIVKGQDWMLDQYKALAIRGILAEEMDLSDSMKKHLWAKSLSAFSCDTQKVLEKEIEFRNSPFRNGPLLQRINSKEVLWHGPKPYDCNL